jgi:predicted NBD/HSP70 family sugar kinase
MVWCPFVDNLERPEGALAGQCPGVIEGMRSELDTRYLTVGIGVAVPGLVRERDGLVRLAPHLGWVDEPLARLLTDATGYPVVAAKDTSLGRWRRAPSVLDAM